MQPMTLGNMRANGVRDLRVYRGGRVCHLQAIINVDRFADDLFIVEINRRFICAVCGAIDAETMPDWPSAMIR